MLIAVVSVVSASLGSMATISNLKRIDSHVALNAHSMAWGAIAAAAFSIFLERPFNFSFETDYVLSLVFLSVFGSAVAFACLLTLIRTIGAARSAYTSVLFPIVALTWSTILEDYRWTVPAVVGIAAAVIGNWLALTRVPKKNE